VLFWGLSVLFEMNYTTVCADNSDFAVEVEQFR